MRGVGDGKQYSGLWNSPRQNVVREGNVCYMGHLLDIGVKSIPMNT